MLLLLEHVIAQKKSLENKVEVTVDKRKKYPEFVLLKEKMTLKGKVREEEILFLLLLTKTFSDYQAKTKEEDKIVELFGQKARTLIEKRRQ